MYNQTSPEKPAEPDAALTIGIVILLTRVVTPVLVRILKPWL
jgi:hypothetical protein